MAHSATKVKYYAVCEWGRTKITVGNPEEDLPRIIAQFGHAGHTLKRIIKETSEVIYETEAPTTARSVWNYL